MYKVVDFPDLVEEARGLVGLMSPNVDGKKYPNGSEKVPELISQFCYAACKVKIF